MFIEKSKYIGFCSGVKIAVEKALSTLNEEKKLYSYGEIIHNKDVVNSLEKKGLIVINDILDYSDNNTKLLIRSHGVGKKRALRTS
jgi:4-hydroxy-3-methylbut-2-enyl diphosphate reductase IspH